MSQWKKFILNKCKKLINAHAHIDRSYTFQEINNEEISKTSLITKQQKVYFLYKNHYNLNDIINRFIKTALESENENISEIYTFLDVNSYISDITLLSLLEFKKLNLSFLHKKINIYGIPYKYESIYNNIQDFKKIIKNYNNNLIKGIGFLPDLDISIKNVYEFDQKIYDQSVDYFKYLFNTFYDLNLPFHIHIDQSSSPVSKQTFALLSALDSLKDSIKNTLKIFLIHVLSPSSYENDEFNKLLNHLKKYSNLIRIICCPSAVISNEQYRDLHVPMRNSITRILDFYNIGIKIYIGTDNVEDFFIPFNSYSILNQIEILSHSLRYYDINFYIKILQQDFL